MRSFQELLSIKRTALELFKYLFDLNHIFCLYKPLFQGHEHSQRKSKKEFLPKNEHVIPHFFNDFLLKTVRKQRCEPSVPNDGRIKARLCKNRVYLARLFLNQVGHNRLI